MRYRHPPGRRAERTDREGGDRHLVAGAEHLGCRRDCGAKPSHAEVADLGDRSIGARKLLRGAGGLLNRHWLLDTPGPSS